MEAIVLAGGMGTRLLPIVANVPKCMAPVAGKPFLQYLLTELKKAKFQHVILALGYKHEVVETWLTNYKTSLKISTVIEQTPLGTGGAVKFALSQAEQSSVFVLNGDSFLVVDHKNLLQKHLKKKAVATIALMKMSNFDRYGKVEINDNDQIVRFGEKQYCEKGYINAGVYVINRNALENFPDKFSLEKDFFEPEAGTGKLVGFPTKGYFIDIGVPEDYLRAQRDFC